MTMRKSVGMYGRTHAAKRSGSAASTPSTCAHTRAVASRIGVRSSTIMFWNSSRTSRSSTHAWSAASACRNACIAFSTDSRTLVIVCRKKVYSRGISATSACSPVRVCITSITRA